MTPIFVPAGYYTRFTLTTYHYSVSTPSKCRGSTNSMTSPFVVLVLKSNSAKLSDQRLHQQKFWVSKLTGATTRSVSLLQSWSSWYVIQKHYSSPSAVPALYCHKSLGVGHGQLWSTGQP